ncbi:MAG: hypothetical protein AB2A00_11880 [Myxococcota bacterium]
MALLTGCPNPTPTPDAAQPPVATDAAQPRDASVSDAARDLDVPNFDTGPGCGSITLSGECRDDVLVYCENNQVLESDCAARGRRCELQTELGGYWCVGALGSVCDVEDTDACEEEVACLDGICGGIILDAGAGDGGVPDGGLSDGGATDAGSLDAGAGDAGTNDAA